MKRVAVCLIDRANYGRLLPVMEALRDSPDFDLLTIVGGTMLLDRFGHAWELVAKDFEIHGRVWCEHEGGTTAAMGRSVASSISGFVDQFERLDPDYAIVIGDRHEALGAAIAARYTQTPLIHFQGGETSGCIDNDNRDTITAMAQYHVPATLRAMERVRELDPKATILTIGCPASDLAREIKPRAGGRPLVVMHADTNATPESQYEMASEVLDVMLPLKPIVLWPNIDAGSDLIAKRIRQSGYADTRKNIPPREYMQMLADAPILVGNSSSFVRDSSFFGTPAVIVGARQFGRDTCGNVAYSGPGKLCEAVRQWRGVRQPPSDWYGDGHVCERFVKELGRL